jgi:hypothetical protein
MALTYRIMKKDHEHQFYVSIIKKSIGRGVARKATPLHLIFNQHQDLFLV